ncbi:MAG: hypothetical protein KDB02_16320, partial [Acidimicrobiales bacterium]|nr:hypothetical protein [Acidimicrobiales bacterium]
MSRGRPFAFRLIALTLCVVGLATTACSKGESASAPTTTTRAVGSPINGDDIDRLAQMLFLDYQVGGARISASVTYDDLSITVTGAVDWREHTGRLDVTTSDGQGGERTQQVRFTADTVFDRITPEQAARLPEDRRGTVKWVARPPSPDQRPIDRVIELLVSLAASRPDNPQLVAQKQVTYEGTETVGERKAFVYTSAKVGATYWLDADSGHLLRFRGSLPGFAEPIVIDLSEQGPTEIELPGSAEQVRSSD